MRDFFLQLKEKFSKPTRDMADGEEESYVQVDSSSSRDESKAKVTVRPFIMEEFEDIKEILDVLREGSTIALVNIKPLREKDLIELKRAISKLRKTCEAIEGDIAGFGEDYVVAVPYFAKIFRGNLAAAAPDQDMQE
ncbi:cell division protein SepF [Candidatus Woesearchaeota archaeon]|nr:cell division protein SepF [Candidatus Woesearchaeota archaeon]